MEKMHKPRRCLNHSANSMASKLSFFNHSEIRVGKKPKKAAHRERPI